jgi:molybdate transport system permease protein
MTVDWLTLTEAEWTAIRLSLKVASVAALASLPLGVLVAYLLARRDFPGKSLVDGIVHLPLVLPPVVTGYVLLILFGKNGPIGAFLHSALGVTLSFRWTGAALACAVMGFPLMVRAIRVAMEAIDPRHEEVARSLGAPPLWVFATVTLPLALTGILSGTVLCFAKALGEFGATITFVSNIPGETQTIPSAIFTYTQSPGGDAGAIRLSLVAIMISLAALFVSNALARRANHQRVTSR